jgi:hypothetical protein
MKLPQKTALMDLPTLAGPKSRILLRTERDTKCGIVKTDEGACGARNP